MLFPALFALGGAFFFFVLRVQGADGSFPKPLTPDEEAVLLRRMQQDGDAEAREKLIEHNLRLVAHIVKKYYAVSTEQDDLLSIGTIGLIKAVNTFKADKNIRLATYASKCIQNELLMYFRQKRKSAGELRTRSSRTVTAMRLPCRILSAARTAVFLPLRSRTGTMPCTARWQAVSLRVNARSSACGTASVWHLPCRSVRLPRGWVFRAAMFRALKSVRSKSFGRLSNARDGRRKSDGCPLPKKILIFFAKRVDESRILIYTKQVVSDESSKRQQNLTNSRIV